MITGQDRLTLANFANFFYSFQDVCGESVLVFFFLQSAACFPSCDKIYQLTAVDTNFLHKGSRYFNLPLFLDEKDKYLKRAVNLI